MGTRKEKGKTVKFVRQGEFVREGLAPSILLR